MMSLPSFPMTKNSFWTVITILDLDENESAVLDVLLTLDQVLILKEKRWRKRGRRGGILTRLRLGSNRPPLPSVLFAWSRQDATSLATLSLPLPISSPGD